MQPKHIRHLIDQANAQHCPRKSSAADKRSNPRKKISANPKRQNVVNHDLASFGNSVPPYAVRERNPPETNSAGGLIFIASKTDMLSAGTCAKFSPTDS
jgi:hypothetical protein